MKPIDAKTDADICLLERDNFPDNNTGFSILMGTKHISLHFPPDFVAGEGRWLEFPRDEFDAIVKWYTGQ